MADEQPQDPYAGTYSNSVSNSQAQQRGALAALAQGGSAGLGAYNQAISQTAGARDQALQAASKRSSLIGGPESAAGNYTAPISNTGNAAVAGLSANRNAFSNSIAANQVANKNYFTQLNAAAPVEELAMLRAQAARGQSKMTQEERDAQIIGEAQSNIAGLNATKAKDLQAEQNDQGQLGKQISQKQKDIQDAYNSYNNFKKQGLTADTVKNTLAKGGTVEQEAAAERKQLLQNALTEEGDLKKLQDQMGGLNNKYNDPANRAIPSLSDSALQTAQKYGYTPEQASVLYGQGGTKITPYQEKSIVNNNADEIKQIQSWSAGATPSADILKAAGVPLTKGRLAQEDYVSLIQKAPGVDDTTKQYLIGTYANKFKTRKQIAKDY